MNIFQNPYYFKSIDKDLASCMSPSPLVDAPRLAKVFGLKELLLKLEGSLPFSHTFKDRGAITAISYLVNNSYNRVLFASCGNMGAAIALTAARKDIKAYAIMSSEASMANLAAINNSCANYIVYNGRFDELDSVVADFSTKHPDIPCINTNMMSEYAKGLKSLYYEIFESLHEKYNEINIVVPTADGTLMSSLYDGYVSLKSKHPDFVVHFVLVQPSGCAPIVKSFKTGKPINKWDGSKTSVLSLSVDNPFINGNNALNAVYNSKGTAIDVNEDFAKSMFVTTCKHEGIMIDDVGSIVIGSLETLRKDSILRNFPTVCLLTSNGLKTIEKTQCDYSSHLVVDRDEITSILLREIYDKHK